MRLFARIKLICWVLSLLWVPVLIAVVSGGGANTTAWWMAGFLFAVWSLISVLEGRKAAQLARGTPGRALPAAFLTWVALGWLRRWAKVDPIDPTPGIRTLGEVYTERVHPAPNGLRAEIRLTHDQDVSAWQNASGSLLRAMMLNPGKGHELRVTLARPGVMAWRVTVSDPLLRGVTWEQVPSGACALTEDGEGVHFPMFHTLIVAATGGGKGSMLWGITWSQLALTKLGTGIRPRLYGIDPKRSELSGPVTAAFEQVAYEPEDMAAVIVHVHDEVMTPRKGHGRDFKPTEDMPPVLFIVDELPSLFSGMDRTQAKEAAAKYDAILRQGRSLGVIIVAASQEATKEVISARNSYGWRIAGRLEKAADTDMLMGQGAAEAGCLPHRIAPATPANRYATAGICYVQDETGQMVRARFPFTSDNDLTRIGEQYATQQPQTEETEIPSPADEPA